MTILGRREKALDGREVMELWVELGSLAKVEKLYRTKGIVNPRDGQPFSANTFWRSASIFMVNSPEEAKEFYITAGAILTDEQWELLVLRRAVQLYKHNRSTFLRWVVVKEWPRKYEHIYREEFVVEPEDYDFYTQLSRKIPSGAARQSKRRDALQE